MSAIAHQVTRARSRGSRLADAAVERARLSVVPRRSRPESRGPFVVMVSLLLVAGVVGLLLFNTSLQQASFTGTALERRAAALDAREQSLQMELQDLRDPQHVAAQAQGIGMVPAPNPAFLRLGDGTVLGDPVPAGEGDLVRIDPRPLAKPRSLRVKPLIVRVPVTTAGDAAAGTADDGAPTPDPVPGDGMTER